MKFDVEVWLDGDRDRPDTLLEAVPDVDVRWSGYGQTKQITVAFNDAGAEVVRMETFDDYPIEINKDCIKIDGLVPGNLRTERYGYWRLYVVGHKR